MNKFKYDTAKVVMWKAMSHRNHYRSDLEKALLAAMTMKVRLTKQDEVDDVASAVRHLSNAIRLSRTGAL